MVLYVFSINTTQGHGTINDSGTLSLEMGFVEVIDYLVTFWHFPMYSIHKCLWNWQSTVDFICLYQKSVLVIFVTVSFTL